MVPQESIAKTIEEKVTGEQRRYLLNELLKAIKKVLQPLFSFCFFYTSCIKNS
jgi:ATP-dependent Lon protease